MEKKFSLCFYELMSFNSEKKTEQKTFSKKKLPRNSEIINFLDILFFTYYIVLWM